MDRGRRVHRSRDPTAVAQGGSSLGQEANDLVLGGAGDHHDHFGWDTFQSANEHKTDQIVDWNVSRLRDGYYRRGPALHIAVESDRRRWRSARPGLFPGPSGSRSRLPARSDRIQMVAHLQSAAIVCVHNSEYTEIVGDSESQLSVREARARFADVITRAQGGSPTVITRNGQAVAAVVPIEDFNALEDAIDRYFAREADRDLAEDPGARTYSMSDVVAAIFEEEPAKCIA